MGGKFVNQTKLVPVKCYPRGVTLSLTTHNESVTKRDIKIYNFL